MQVLVTGGAGFIGSHLVDCLIADGHEVEVVDDFSSGYIDNLFPLVQRPLKVISKSAFEYLPELKGMTVYHLAAHADISWSLEHPFDAISEDAGMTLFVARRCMEDGADRLIFCSSSGIYAQADFQEEDVTLVAPATPYAAAKVSGEAIVRMMAPLGLPSLSVRPMNVYGPRQRIGGTYRPVVPSFLTSCIRKEPITIDGTGEQSPDMVFVKDAARWLAGLTSTDRNLLQGQPVNIGSGQSTPIREIARLCMDVTDTIVPITYTPARRWYFERTKASTERMASFGPIPSTQLRDGLSETAAFYEAKEARKRHDNFSRDVLGAKAGTGHWRHGLRRLLAR